MKGKVIGKFIGWALAGLLLVSVVGVGVIYFYQDKIISLFVAEANKHTKTKVQVSKISLSLWDKFPQVAVTLDQVRIIESLAGSTQPLATAAKIYCTFNLWDVLNKRYQVRELFLEDGEIALKVLPDGAVNYLIFEKDTTASTKDFAFNLDKIALKNIQISYSDAGSKHLYKAKAHNMQAALAIKPGAVTVQTTGNLLVQTLQLNQDAYFQEKETQINTALTLNASTKQIAIAPSVIQVGSAAYELKGTVSFAGPTNLDLKIAGKNTNVQSVLALLPQKFSKKLSQYKSSGAVYFNGAIKGIASVKQTPYINFSFGCRNASFYHPEYKQKLQNISFAGSFTNGTRYSAQTSVLELKNIKGTLENRPFSGHITYQNFNDPTLSGNLKADIEVQHVLGLFPVPEIKNGSGQAKIAVNFSGKIREFKGKTGRAGLASSGDITLHNVTLQLRDYVQPFRNLSGTFLVRKNDMAVTNFKGWLGDSDFLLNGYFKNVLSWLFLDNQSLRIEADLECRFLNFDQLLSGSLASNGNPGKSSATISANNVGPQDYKLAISPYLDFDLNAQVQHLQFRRFKGKAMHGTVRLKDQIISSPGMALQIMGGKFGVKGTLDARQTQNIKITTTTAVSNIKLDSLFYVFENFGQDFLQQRHLRGALTATIDSDLYFDSKLNSKTDKMEAEITAAIHNGQLLNFEPMQKLSVFANRHELANLRFPEVKNTFYIQSRTIYIPEMEIRSNISNASLVSIQGTHSFDQQMDYKFRIPILQKAKRPDKDEAYGHVEEVVGSNTNLFLTLKGNENNYKIAYDKERVKEKIASDFQREKQELKEAFKGKQPDKKKEVKLEEDKYFNF